MSREDFALCTPDEFQAIYDAWFSREEVEMHRSWEIGRFIAAIVLQPYSKTPIRPTAVYKFPWEEDSGEDAAAPKGISTPERAQEMAERMGKMEANLWGDGSGSRKDPA